MGDNLIENAESVSTAVQDNNIIGPTVFKGNNFYFYVIICTHWSIAAFEAYDLGLVLGV